MYATLIFHLHLAHCSATAASCLATVQLCDSNKLPSSLLCIALRCLSARLAPTIKSQQLHHHPPSLFSISGQCLSTEAGYILQCYYIRKPASLLLPGKDHFHLSTTIVVRASSIFSYRAKRWVLSSRSSTLVWHLSRRSRRLKLQIKATPLFTGSPAAVQLHPLMGQLYPQRRLKQIRRRHEKSIHSLHVKLTRVDPKLSNAQISRYPDVRWT